MIMRNLIQTSVKNNIMTLTIGRPEKKNAITEAMYLSMTNHINEARQAKDVKVLVITGADDCFTSGNDLKDFLENPPNGLGSPVFQFMYALCDFEKPIIGAVNGPAIGIGVTLLMHCDLVFATESATFQLPFINLGLVPEFGSSLILPMLIGHARASEALMLGKPFNSETALKMGLVNSVFSDSTLMPHTLDTAKVLASKPPRALQKTKALINQNKDAVKAQIKIEAEAFAVQLVSAEVKEAINAFFEKRKPDFTNLEP
ncbi:MAG: enoyl-CoA hydratase [Rhodospirillaceae bacterium]|nr:enoyl-CoA hydratase [Rhodospirillaceae bacterium]